MQRRRKVGGIIDRRFGEDDPSIAPEEKALQRFVKEKQMGRKKGTLFDLEDDEDNEEELTHLGKSLSFDYGKVTDVLDEDGLVDSQDEDADAEGAHRSRKRRRLLGSDGEQGSETLLQTAPDRPKTKQEVMKEVIAKSKFHKYERQKNKEDDDDLRAELDRGLSDIYDLMRGTKATSAVLEAKMILNTEPTMNPDRAALLNGKDRSQADKEYDERLRQMAFDARSKPTTRTKTEDEKLYEEARKLKELEEKRLARMRGDETEDTADGTMLDFEGDDGAENVEEDAVGLGQGIPVQSARNELGVEDEDDFDLDDDLIASSFETDISEADDSGASSAHPDSSDDEAEFVKDLLSNEDIAREEFRHSAYETRSSENGAKSTLAFTYPCPQTHQELLEVTKDVSVCDLPIVIQRIRAVNHPKLASGNKAKLGVFSGILVEHIYYMANQPTPPPFSVLESMIRHVHSLAKSFPGDVGRAARKHLKEIQDQRPTAFNAGDMVIFTAIGSIFPTSDHFHQVVTPAILSMARYLGQRVPHSLADLVHATYVATLCLQYQRLSKRYIPEAVNHSLQVMSVLSPTKSAKPFGPFPDRASASQLRIGAAERGNPATNRQLRFWDLNHISDVDIARDEELKEVLLEANLSLTSAMAELWISKTAFYEIFDPFSHAFGHLLSKDCFIKLRPSVRVHSLSRSHTT
jgi:nucleolar protein 14